MHYSVLQDVDAEGVAPVVAENVPRLSRDVAGVVGLPDRQACAEPFLHCAGEQPSRYAVGSMLYLSRDALGALHPNVYLVYSVVYGRGVQERWERKSS